MPHFLTHTLSASLLASSGHPWNFPYSFLFSQGKGALLTNGRTPSPPTPLMQLSPPSEMEMETIPFITPWPLTPSPPPHAQSLQQEDPTFPLPFTDQLLERAASTGSCTRCSLPRSAPCTCPAAYIALCRLPGPGNPRSPACSAAVAQLLGGGHTVPTDVSFLDLELLVLLLPCKCQNGANTVSLGWLAIPTLLSLEPSCAPEVNQRS